MEINLSTKEYDRYPACPAAQFCGGCSYQGVLYEDQLKNKLGEVCGIFKNAGFSPEIIAEIKPSPDQYFYRNKMEYTFGNEVKDGPTILGLHKKKSFMSIVDCSKCTIVHEDYNKILNAVIDFCTEKGYKHYNKKMHSDLLRNLIIRRGVRTGELLVNIVTASDAAAAAVFDEAAFAQMLFSLDLQNKIVGVLRTINDKLADAIIPEDVRIIYGRDYYMEKVLDLDFKVGAFSFFQTNVEAAERLYADALKLIPGIEGKTVFDLYCGTGTISQAMALEASKVVGVEIVEEAVEAAKENAKLNGLENCEFIAGDVEKVVGSLTDKPDVIVVDPPRAGISPKALAGIAGFGVNEILYISCNPKTLAENLRAFRLCGYAPGKVTLYDNFPFTKHIESAVLLTKV